MAIAAASNSGRSNSSSTGTAQARDPDTASFEIDGVVSRNRSGEPFYIDNTGHPANRRLALARARGIRVQGFGLALDFAGRGNNGHFAPFAWAA